MSRRRTFNVDGGTVRLRYEEAKHLPGHGFIEVFPEVVDGHATTMGQRLALIFTPQRPGFRWIARMDHEWSGDTILAESLDELLQALAHAAVETLALGGGL